MPRYRIGVLGHTGRGNYGHGMDRVWLDVPNCEIVAVADPDDEGRRAALERLNVSKGFADYHELLDQTKPDIVSVCPRWLDQHHQMVLAAAARGIHIYMEKPMCQSLEEADAMVAACEKNNAKLAIAHQTRYSPKLPVVSDLIFDGAIGDVLELRGRGKEDRRGGGEDLWVLGCHIMNLIRYFGGDARWCFASVLQDGHTITRDDVKPGNEGIGPLAGDTVRAMYGLDDGVTAYFGSRRDAGDGNRFGLQIYGSKGVIEILTGPVPAVYLLQDATWSPGRSGQRWRPVSSLGVEKDEPLADGSLHAGNVLACRDLIAAIEEDRQPECNVYEARNTVEMIAAVFESQRQRGPVEMPLKNRKNPLDLL